jgi:aspartate 1-decarboxylase
MMLSMLKSKIHRAAVTGANINYNGSIGIDEEFLERVSLYENERVEVYNITNGSRLSTYIIKEPRGSKSIILNGAAARLAHTGDRIIIAAYAYIDEKDVEKHKPKVLILDENNNPE